jgi:hypothetical protein
LETGLPTPEELPGSFVFVRGALGVLTGFGLFALLMAWVAVSIDKPAGVNAETALLYAHAAFLALSLPSSAGLMFRRRWAWWTGLAAFGLLAAMAAFLLVLIVWPRPMLGGLVDRDWWPLAVAYSLCAAPGALLLRPGRVYRDLLR